MSKILSLRVKPIKGHTMEGYVAVSDINGIQINQGDPVKIELEVVPLSFPAVISSSGYTFRFELKSGFISNILISQKKSDNTIKILQDIYRFSGFLVD